MDGMEWITNIIHIKALNGWSVQNGSDQSVQHFSMPYFVVRTRVCTGRSHTMVCNCVNHDLNGEKWMVCNKVD